MGYTVNSWSINKSWFPKFIHGVTFIWYFNNKDKGNLFNSHQLGIFLVVLEHQTFTQDSQQSIYNKLLQSEATSLPSLYLNISFPLMVFKCYQHVLLQNRCNLSQLFTESETSCQSRFQFNIMTRTHTFWIKLQPLLHRSNSTQNR